MENIPGPQLLRQCPNAVNLVRREPKHACTLVPRGKAKPKQEISNQTKVKNWAEVEKAG